MRRNLKIYALSLALPMLGVLFAVTEASAKFIVTNPYVYQHPDPKSETVVIISTEGIFVAHRKTRKTSVSAFTLESLLPEDSATMFFSFKPNTTVLDRVLLADNDIEYAIGGTFTIRLSDTCRVSKIDNGQGSLITVIAGTPGQERILGIIGNQVVFNLEGKKAVALFEVDLPWVRHKGVIEPYDLKDNQLFLGETTVAADKRLGVDELSDNFCLAQGVPIVPRDKFKSLLALDKEKQRLQVKKISIAQKRKSPMDNLLILSVADKYLIAIDFESNDLFAIKEHSVAGKQVCSKAGLDL